MEKTKYLYRCEAREYAVLDRFGDFVSPPFPDPKIVFTKYKIVKETPKGYWIAIAGFSDRDKQWVKKYARKRYAASSKEEALNDFLLRTKKRIKILKREIDFCKTAVINAEKLQTTIKTA